MNLDTSTRTRVRQNVDRLFRVFNSLAVPVADAPAPEADHLRAIRARIRDCAEDLMSLLERDRRGKP